MDALVLALTWRKTFAQWRAARALAMQLSVSTCLLRDGTWYFCGLLALSVAEMLTFNTAFVNTFNAPPSPPPSQAPSPLASFAQIMPCVLVNHFVLNLRTLGTGGVSSASCTSTLRFRALVSVSGIGDIGAELRVGVQHSEDEQGEVSENEGLSAVLGW
ncbi:hypothetical protein PsYK624_065820 [Phanerochaete sordida]|uniref:Uncharacterized protein n=1 Tax=Phanerochaete sordida TaxID=48140 RepID=A0A9P3LDZ6_9APHY|nr:hypothetical protein PsYK624_065820 [Phanerochaete sordida]